MLSNNLKTNEGLVLEMKAAYQEVCSFIEKLDEEAFRFSPEGKWSSAGQLEHLILSSKGVASALKMSKLKLMIFGKSKNGSMSYDELYKIYKEALSKGQKAPSGFAPSADQNFSKEELLSNWKTIAAKLEERIPKWSEKDLDRYRLPHPAIGKITVREMLYFTIFHTRHHLESMKALMD